MTLPDDYNVVFVPLPGDIYACVRVDINGYPTVYINVGLSQSARKKALAHELRHVEQGDFFNHDSIWDVEHKAIREEGI